MLLLFLCTGLGIFQGCALEQHVRGEYYLSTDNYDQGIHAFEKQLADDPGNPAVNYYLGRFYLAAGHSRKALPLLKKAVTLNPDNADYHFWLGVAYAANHNSSKERSSYLTALSINPRHALALTYIGHNQFEKNQLRQALVSYRNALEINPTIEQALFNRGLILKRLKRTPEEKDAWKAYLSFYDNGKKARAAVRALNALGDFEYRNYAIGKQLVTIRSLQFKPFTVSLYKESKESADRIGRAFLQTEKSVLHVVTYQKNNRTLARDKAKSIKAHFEKKFPEIATSRIKLSWFGTPEKVRRGKKHFWLDQSVTFFTGKVG